MWGKLFDEVERNATRIMVCDGVETVGYRIEVVSSRSEASYRNPKPGGTRRLPRRRRRPLLVMRIEDNVCLRDAKSWGSKSSNRRIENSRKC
jgi:hypothetical protein